MEFAWEALGVLWRIFLVAVPIGAIIWALTKGRNVDSAEMARARREIEERHLPPPPPVTFTGG